MQHRLHFAFVSLAAVMAFLISNSAASPQDAPIGYSVYDHDPDARYMGRPPLQDAGRTPSMERRRTAGGGFFSTLFGGDSGPIPRRLVSFEPQYKPGTIVIRHDERRLYYVTREGEAVRYGVGVGRPGFGWRGSHRVTAKREWPDWTPPPQMLRRQPDLPRWMPGGVDNPLGARALYLGSTLFRIHGSNEPDTIGAAVSSGCIRMTNDDVIDLYNRVQLGALVIVQ